MKYVCLTHFYIEHNRGGGELMLHALLSELAKRHEVTVLITDTQSADGNLDGVNVRYTTDRTADLLNANPDVIMSRFNNAEHVEGARGAVCHGGTHQHELGPPHRSRMRTE